MVVELLLAQKADVNPRDINGATPLLGIPPFKHKEVADLLVQHGGKT
jgi:ankyrin repeat protein